MRTVVRSSESAIRPVLRRDRGGEASAESDGQISPQAPSSAATSGHFSCSSSSSSMPSSSCGKSLGVVRPGA